MKDKSNRGWAVKGEWRKTTLDRLGQIVTGKTPSSRRPEYFGGNILFVTPTDFNGRRLIESTERYLTEKGANAVQGARIPCGAVMATCIGSDMGKSAIAVQPCVTNQQINSIIVGSDSESLFVYYNLSYRKEEIRNSAAGSAQPILNKSAFGQLEILLPPLPEQRTIAHILGTLDDKIELNRRMNETLEAMALALFKSWFVDFDPVRAKIEGRDTGLPQPIADLFPDRLVDSELGEIPEGWEVKPLDSIACFQNGLALQKFRPSQNEARLPVVKIAQLRAGESNSGEWASATIKPECIIENGDVVFSWSGSLLVQTWCGGRAALNQHLFKVTSERYPKWFYLHSILSHFPEFRRIAKDKATTMGHIRRHHLTDALCVVPPGGVIARVSDMFGGLLERQVANEVACSTLVTLRDALLPKLVSGEVRLGDALQVTETAN